MSDAIDPIARLEERIAWLERHVTEQDKVMLAQGDALRKLAEELTNLRERQDQKSGALDADEKPPHF